MKWGINRNVVPGHHKHLKGGKVVRLPGYDVYQPHPWSIFGGKREKRASHATWFKPFKSKPINRREKRGQGKPR